MFKEFPLRHANKHIYIACYSNNGDQEEEENLTRDFTDGLAMPGLPILFGKRKNKQVGDRVTCITSTHSRAKEKEISRHFAHSLVSFLLKKEEKKDVRFLSGFFFFFVCVCVCVDLQNTS